MNRQILPRSQAPGVRDGARGRHAQVAIGGQPVGGVIDVVPIDIETQVAPGGHLTAASHHTADGDALVGTHSASKIAHRIDVQRDVLATQQRAAAVIDGGARLLHGQRLPAVDPAAPIVHAVADGQRERTTTGDIATAGVDKVACGQGRIAVPS
ncbi:hypothetical protein D3C86_1795270 [compost metagenome]